MRRPPTWAFCWASSFTPPRSAIDRACSSRWGGGLDYFNVEGFDDIQFGVGAGVGGKIPAGDRFAVRIEANYLRGFESDGRFAANIIQGLVGFSFFTR